MESTGNNGITDRIRYLFKVLPVFPLVARFLLIKKLELANGLMLVLEIL
jgi:hypothetical protein